MPCTEVDCEDVEWSVAGLCALCGAQPLRYESWRIMKYREKARVWVAPFYKLDGGGLQGFTRETYQK